ncbi:MAG TPA: methionyl-tRNA formyltransferase [Thermomicrobiales bacterium]|nr:methionyl-tRNA formyltransferase [Thermomicrobiales bacterium]
MKPRVIYMGTPDFAVPALGALASSGICDVALVVTQPDRRAGRGKNMVSPAVKVAADARGLPVLQTATLRHPEIRQRIVDLAPDLVVVAAFGMILGRWILELPPRGCVNLHASLLPKYRGANPIASAIAMGEAETGVSLMKMDRGLDTGPVYATVSLPILADDTTASLTSRLSSAAGDLLIDHLPDLLSGAIEAQDQGAGASLTRMMTKDDGWLDFARPAVELERQIRAMWPWPRAWTTDSKGERIQIHAATVGEMVDAAPGTVVHREGRVLVATGSGSIELRRVQLPGGRPLESTALVHHPALADDAILGTIDAPAARPPLVTEEAS